ncbi:MAG: RNase adapter RapZ [Ruminococcaceae bacterium]|nr:RNase adapter RapZ [Oscillospiraceae bacterium]
MKFVIITGMSGSGKSQAVNFMEDMGYYCIDNMPPSLFSKFADLCNRSEGKFDKIAFVIDTRTRELFTDALDALDTLKDQGESCEIVFLDASDEVILKRYKESRRNHPLADDGRVIDGIKKERKILSDIKKKADYIVDTSTMPTKSLRAYLNSVFNDREDETNIFINVLSFGFKYGIPLDADLVFDVRFLPNPYYIPELKHMTGLDQEVQDFVNNCEQTAEFKKKLDDLIKFTLPLYVEEGKSQLVIAIGCTGGKHRSVTIANHVYKTIIDMGFSVKISHRDVSRLK